MPVYTVYTLPESEITVSGGGQLSGITQGDGSHLVGLDITLNSNNWITVDVDDNDTNFADNDSSQTLDSAITYDGESYGAGTRVEAEFRFTVQDPGGNTYELIAFNLVEGGGVPYGTIEGLAFVGTFPPQGVPLTVLSAAEGPRNSGGSSTTFGGYATPPCFAAGCKIKTASGARKVEDLVPGELVMTLDHGLQQIRWVGRRHITGSMLAVAPHLRPIRVKAHALGRNDPHRDTLLSPQHRVLLTGWQAELVSGYREVLVPVKALVNDEEIRVISPPEGVVYHHILFDDHEIIWGDGLRSESLNPSRRALQGFDVQARAELLEIFPELDGAETQYPLARTLVGGAEMGLLAELYEKRT